MEIYLDNSATTKVAPEVAKIMFDLQKSNSGNASSLHKLGIKAAKIRMVMNGC